MKYFTLILFVSSLLFAEVSTDNKFNVSAFYSMNFDKNTSCLVRHIKVYKEPKWVAKIKVRNGKTVYFSSPKSLFEFYHRPGKWFDVGVKSERDFSEIVVTDYETLKPINAETAFYIYGSRVTSPAGDDLVAIETKEAAEKFAKIYSGKRIFKFDEVSDALIRLINGRI
ncbi:MAG: nitrous oxide reductase accessory protein NosL [Campylobacterota bacterium]|nr:nitrous oxide reductase accessory protein NosL [Campylobacterota bacterium]